ncbi:hypothetical protein EKO04_000891 [Ascochyta lentis]|uniref:Uncharacterized protein n=1 Tax=Ascochyta lentis TaxID=205686 RepID=A0A8H7JC67_9PLEO|nr:hypothetical protein EKO04_000891 [Ascochyta lentis]
MTSHPPITLRQPLTSTPSPPQPSPPPLSWLTGSWNVTHSTLPMWKKSRNVRITYTALPTRTNGLVEIDDVVSYQGVNKSKKRVSTVRGVDKASSPPSSSPSAPAPATTEAQEVEREEKASPSYTWRGRGLLMIATSKWEILGWGDEAETGNQWVVTFFQKTLFTPAGVDVYARRGQLRGETVERIKGALEGLGGEVGTLAGAMFEVAFDGEREGEV